MSAESRSEALPPRPLPGFRRVPRTGVIYVMHRAAERGFRSDDPGWVNLGQGSPETGPLPGAPPRVDHVELSSRQHAYGPVEGTLPLRQRIAELYNDLYRRGRPSRYGAENVCIAGGGRSAVTRIIAAMAEVNLGHLIPDYTAYEELLGAFKGFVPIPILLSRSNGYRASADELRDEILGRGLSALLCSNPSNPTGQVVEGEALGQWIEVARQCRATFVLDEFYSHFVYTDGPEPLPGCRLVSAAEWIEDVDRDPVILVDGLTKNWRYPGWRVSWILGPRQVIEQVTSAGSFLDGGANHAFQAAAIDLLDPERVAAETRAIQAEFRRKGKYMAKRLRSLGVHIDAEPGGAFYLWGDLSRLPPPLDDGMQFFEHALEHRVITVPGEFFDVNPGRRRAGVRYKSYSRFSFGPEMAALERGLDALERLVAAHR